MLLSACLGSARVPQEADRPPPLSPTINAESQHLHEQLVERYGLYRDAALSRYIESVGGRVAAALPVDPKFFVLDTPLINAYALPNGNVYITRGFLAYLESESELAAVIAHEIAHQSKAHYQRNRELALSTRALSERIAQQAQSDQVRALTDTFGQAMVLGYSRSQELEADHLSVDYLSAAGFDAQAVRRVLALIVELEHQAHRDETPEEAQDHEIFATHPDTGKRLAQIDSRRPRRARQEDRVTDRDRYLAALEGMIYGVPEGGCLQRDQRIYFSGAMISLGKPQSWSMQAGARGCIAYPAQEDRLLLVHVAHVNPKRDARGNLQDVFPGVAFKDGAAIRMNGLRGYTALLSDPEHLDRGQALAAILYHDSQALVLNMFAREGSITPAIKADLQRTIAGARKIATGDSEMTRALRLHIRRVDKGETFAGLAARSPLGADFEQELRMLNRAGAGTEPREGEWLKIIE